MRSVAGRAADAGRLDGLTDGLNNRPSDLSLRWRGHVGRPELDFSAYVMSYAKAYSDGIVLHRAWQKLRSGPLEVGTP